MRVLVVGSGGREHALVWKLAGEAGVDEVLAAPGSAAIADMAECVPVAADDIEGLAGLASERGIDLTVVGPEAPLAAGIGDLFAERGLDLFGPSREGARLEASKAFTKSVLTEAGVPTAAYGETAEATEAKDMVRRFGCPVVVKADGLAAGKGVIICTDEAEAGRAIDGMLVDGSFGQAGSRILVEEFLEGEEASFMAVTDGRSVLPLASSQDHKPVFDGDRGPNTGGMGAYSPAPVLTEEMSASIVGRIIEPTVATLAGRGIDFRGVLYAGLMMTVDGPKVLEYNVRFGDPECQPIMARLRSSLLDIMRATVAGELAGVRPEWDDRDAVCVVMSSGGYPGDYQKGKTIEGIERAAALADVTVFHAGTARDDNGRWVTAGGRVLGVTALGQGVGEAATAAYAGVDSISWEDAHWRRDIAHRAIARVRS